MRLSQASLCCEESHSEALSNCRSREASQGFLPSEATRSWTHLARNPRGPVISILLRKLVANSPKPQYAWLVMVKDSSLARETNSHFCSS